MSAAPILRIVFNVDISICFSLLLKKKWVSLGPIDSGTAVP